MCSGLTPRELAMFNDQLTRHLLAVRNLSNPTSSVLSLDDEGTPRAPRQPLDATDRVRNLLADSEARRQRITERKKSTLDRMRAKKLSEDFSRQMTRRWKAGDVYAPHDLSPEEMVKWKQSQRPTKDVLDMLGLNPLDEYRVGAQPISSGGVAAAAMGDHVCS